jgi:WD40 repeat protein
MLYRTNILAIVGGGRSPRYAPNKVILFDEKLGKPQAELEFRSEVKRVILRKDRIVVVLDGKIHVFTLEKSPKLLQAYESHGNPSGLCSVSIAEDSNVMVFPASQDGHVCITGIGGNASVTSIVPAHESPLAALAIDDAGNLLATASEKGTLIRVFDIKSGRLLCELRRGTDRAEIFSIEFNRDGTKLCVASDKGTVHVFSLDGPTNPVNSNAAFAAEYSPLHEEGQNKHSRYYYTELFS